MDASDFSVGAVVEQLKDKEWPSLGFFSKKLTESNRKYSTYDKKLLAA